MDGISYSVFQIGKILSNIKKKVIKMADDKPIIKATTPNSNKYDTKIDVYTSDPKGHHESIHIAVDSDLKSGKYNLCHIDINLLENNLIELKNDLEKVKTISKAIYELNVDNTFFELTEHINNELYAFEFILEQNIKEGKN